MDESEQTAASPIHQDWHDPAPSPVPRHAEVPADAEVPAEFTPWADPEIGTLRAELAEMKLTVSKTFEQTTWICSMVAGVLSTLPPQMRDQILKGGA